MINKRVVEAVFDGGGKGLAVLDIQVGGKRRNDLVVEHGVHEAANGLVMHAVAHDIKAGNPRARNKGGMGTVEDADLALFVRGDVGSHKDTRKTSLNKGKLLGKRLVALDAPHLEGLAHGQEGILVAQTLSHRGGLGCGPARWCRRAWCRRCSRWPSTAQTRPPSPSRSHTGS